MYKKRKLSKTNSLTLEEQLLYNGDLVKIICSFISSIKDLQSLATCNKSLYNLLYHDSITSTYKFTLNRLPFTFPSYFESIKILKIKKGSIYNYNLQQFKNLTHLSIANLFHDKLRTYCNVKNLFKLNVTNLESLTNNDIAHLTNLTSLNITNCSKITSNALTAMSNLIKLKASGINSICTNLNLPNLTKLNIARLSNRELSFLYLNTSNLTNLNVSSNTLQDYNELKKFINLKKFVWIDLLQEISLSLPDSVRKLNLSYINIQKIETKNLTNLISLKLLSVKNLDITNFCNLKSLKSLSVPFTKLLKENLNCKQLTFLNIYGSNIDGTILSQLPQLTTLHCGNNIYDKHLVNSLKSLTITNNNYIYTLQHLSNLESLVLENCVNFNNFNNLSNLKYLTLREMYLYNFNFEPLINVTYLKIEYCLFFNKHYLPALKSLKTFKYNKSYKEEMLEEGSLILKNQIYTGLELEALIKEIILEIDLIENFI